MEQLDSIDWCMLSYTVAAGFVVIRTQIQEYRAMQTEIKKEIDQIHTSMKRHQITSRLRWYRRFSAVKEQVKLNRGRKWKTIGPKMSALNRPNFMWRMPNQGYIII